MLVIVRIKVWHYIFFKKEAFLFATLKILDSFVPYYIHIV